MLVIRQILKELIIDNEMTISIVVQSIAITVAVLASYYISLNLYAPENWQELHRAGTLLAEELREPRSIAFTTLIMCELLRSFSIRSTKYTLFELGIFSNKRLIQGVGVSFLLTLIVVYAPFLNDLFETWPLTFRDWIIILPLSFIPFILGEIWKIIARKK